MDNEERRDEMTSIVGNLDALNRVDNQSISHAASILARLFYNLDESEISTIDEQLLNELKAIVRENNTNTINDVAILALARAELSAEQYEAVERIEEARQDDMDLAIQTVVERAQAEVAVASLINSSRSPSPVSSSPDEEEPITPAVQPLQAWPCKWTCISGQYVCNMCSKKCMTQRGILAHSKMCPKAEKEQDKKPVEKTSRIDYEFRGIRTLEARTCPYCDVILQSCHMIEHHSRKQHAVERVDVYGCSECGRWCVTVMALIKHWDKHALCPNGRLLVRKAAEALGPKNKKVEEGKIVAACGSCGKGFMSRLGGKYHKKHVCPQAEILDVAKLTNEGVQFNVKPIAKGFNLSIVTPPELPSAFTPFDPIASLFRQTDEE